jgi:Flp pilus assembly pilin Flp
MSIRLHDFLRKVKNDRGQGLLEYALIIVLIAIVVLLAVKNIGVTTGPPIK